MIGAFGLSPPTERGDAQGGLSRGRKTFEDGAFGARMASYLGADDGRAVIAQTLLHQQTHRHGSAVRWGPD
jgi:hypothetical protein